MIKCCASCGHPLPDEGILNVPASPQQLAILHLLSAAGTRGLSMGEIMAELWKGRADGGPINARVSVAVQIKILNMLLAPRGLRVVTEPRSGMHSRRYLRTTDGKTEDRSQDTRDAARGERDVVCREEPPPPEAVGQRADDTGAADVLLER